MVQLFLWANVYNGHEAFEQALSVKKTSLDWGTAYVRGFLCNWLVNIAVWQAMSAQVMSPGATVIFQRFLSSQLLSGSQDITGKFIGVLIPITIFVASGFEHIIANQYAIPMGMRLNSGVSVNTCITANFIPVTLGNM